MGVPAQAPPHSTAPPHPPLPLELLLLLRLLKSPPLPPPQLRDSLWSPLLHKEGDKWKHQDYRQHRLGLLKRWDTFSSISYAMTFAVCMGVFSDLENKW